MRETVKLKRARAQLILAQLKKDYPNAATELNYKTPFQLLVSTILSAQATDVSVNKATPALFDKYPDAKSMAKAEPEEIIPYIKTIGLYRNKAKSIIGSAKKLVALTGGELANDFDLLLSLPGVGRKTANVVLSNAFERPAIAVDTHVGRLARRLKFSKHDKPDKVEKDLERLFDKNDWVFLHHALILHGRRVCKARKPDCDNCSLVPYCPSSLAGPSYLS